jgi:hypothetical protein
VLGLAAQVGGSGGGFGGGLVKERELRLSAADWCARRPAQCDIDARVVLAVLLRQVHGGPVKLLRGALAHLGQQRGEALEGGYVAGVGRKRRIAVNSRMWPV